MKDHRAPKIAITPGVAATDGKGFVPMQAGVSPDSLGGGVVKPSQGIYEGVPMDNFTYVAPPKAAIQTGNCAGNDGTCMAYPMKDTKFCYGHSRGK